MRPKWQLTLIASGCRAGWSLWSVWYSYASRGERQAGARQSRCNYCQLPANYCADGWRRRSGLRTAGRAAGLRAGAYSGTSRWRWRNSRARSKPQPGKIRQVMDYVASANLRDADRLAFLDLFEELAAAPAPPPAVKTELDDLHSDPGQRLPGRRDARCSPNWRRAEGVRSAKNGTDMWRICGASRAARKF